MKKLKIYHLISKLWLLLLLSFSMPSFGQHTNDWIDYTKPYFKIKITAKGIYRINASTLTAVGLNFIDSENYQLFRNGVQVPIYINKTGSNVNYIEFYGFGNDGILDSMVFSNPNHQIQDKMSLFSSEAIYYLTFNNSGSNLRINDIANNLNNLPPKEAFFYYTVFNQYTAQYSYGKSHYLGGTPLYSALFEEGEGYMGNDNQQVNNTVSALNFNVSTPFVYTQNGADAYLKSSVVSWSSGAHHFKLKSGSTLINEFNFSGFKLVKSDDVISNSLLNTQTSITLEAVPTSSGTNRNNLAYLEIKYPRAYNFGATSFFQFEVQGNGNVQYLEIENFNNQSTQPILYDVTNGYRLVALDAPSSSVFRYALPASTNLRTLVLRANNASQYTLINALTESYFEDYTASNKEGNYIILSHPSLITSTELQNYKNYRESLAGGAYQVSIVNIVELYDQFAYGVDHHAATVRNFLNYAIAEWTVKPEYVFIIGKGREYQEYRNNATVRAACLVPTFGNPGSDHLLVADKSTNIPLVPVGRIAANSASQIATYLEKVISYENEINQYGDPYQTIANKDFMKHILHFGGGGTAGQQLQFRNYLDQYKNIVEDTLWGAEVYSAFKTNSNPLQTIQSEFLRNRVDEGVSLITFFGHSYAGGFDVSFDEPENYTNIGKYPIFLANGCNAGAIHSSGSSISERFIFASQKGAIAYLSTTSLSVDASLNTFSNYFYSRFSQSDYTKSLGTVIQNTIADVVSCCSNSPLVLMTPFEMTLNGDPALKLNQYDRPDYALESQNISFSPQVVSTSLDSFSLNIKIVNLGKAINENINVEVTRILPNGSQIVVSKNIAAPYYVDSVSFKFPVLVNTDGLGLNQFNIYVDNNDVVSNELSETNNYLLNSISLVIGSDDIYPIFPYEFAIVPNQGQILKASTGNAFAPATNYIFQIDTTALFTNPLNETTINSAGGVVNYQPNIIFQDSTVYYWRVKSVTSNLWQSSSFIYLANEFPGWNQSHYFQWQKDNYSNVILDTDRTFKFVDDVKDVFIQTGVYPNIPYQELKWELNGALMHNWSMNICSGSGGFGYPNGLSIAAIDNISGIPVDYVNIGGNYGQYGNIHCNNASNIKNIANFRTTGVTAADHPTPGVPWADVIINYLNSIPNNYYVLMYSVNNPSYANWSPILVNYLNAKGSAVSNATAGPMILMYQNNNAAFTPVNVIGNSFSDIINVHVPITGVWNEGNFKSTKIGPAQEWGSFHWRYHASENPSSDIQYVEIYGIGNNDSETLLSTVHQASDTTLQFINAQNYPYIRLKWNTTDLIDRTPSQADYWRVLYKPAPEIAINPNLYFSLEKDTLLQGENFNMKVALENVSSWQMDSVWVKENTLFANGTNENMYKQYDSLQVAFDTLQLSYNKNSLSAQYIGTNQVVLEANPLDFQHQLEQFHFNNFAIFDFKVLGDTKNPLLDVTFDGVHILDGDIVSAKPEIQIQLKDENPFLALDDTTSMDIYLRNTQDGQMRRIAYNDINVAFIPAQNGPQLAKNNKALVIIKENFSQDGIYELIVKAKDKSGNNSSNTEDRIVNLTYYDYKISFEVITKSSISNIMNYPNPFTTQTQFVFTLTGASIPETFTISIYNIKGTLIKQIRKEELGNLHIGINRTQYHWDGTDQYGDKVANGVYLYKVNTEINNEEIDHYGIEQVDKFFTKGFGKMVFIR